MDQRQQYGVLIALGGLLLAGVQLLQGMQQLSGFTGTTRATVFLFETGPFVIIGLSLTVIGYWVTKQTAYERDLPRVVAWALGSILLFASVGALLLFSLEVTVSGEILAQTPYVIVDLITVGAVVGVLLGLYDAQSRARKRELEAERDRVKQFARKAADINNYGRELNRSESIEEVSALCIQSVQAFLGLTNMAFILTDGDTQELIDDTTVGIDKEKLRQLSETAREQEPGSVVVTHAAAGFPESTSIITACLTNNPEQTAVLIALADADLSLHEEDKQLLELLISHASTALEGTEKQNAKLSKEAF